MAKHVFYAYIDGYDLDATAPKLMPEFDAFIASRQWAVSGMKVVNDRGGSVGKSGDLPRWDFGLNFDLPDDPEFDPRWFRDLEDVAVFLRAMSAKSNREFVCGACEPASGYTYDLFFIDSGPVPIERIRRAFQTSKRQTAEPGATDNPDDAQRLREDY